MLDIFPVLDHWVEEHRPFALATVVKTWGSSPRRAGSAMVITSDLQVEGSVSGGCIEGTVIEAAQQVLLTGEPETMLFGVSDDDAWSVGLTCGGKVQVHLERFIAFDPRPEQQEVWKALRTLLSERMPGVLLTRLASVTKSHLLVFPDGTSIGDWGEDQEKAIQFALETYKTRQSKVVAMGEASVFAQVFTQRPRLLIVGAAHIALPLVRFAHHLQFETIVIDPRGIFATASRFPMPPDRLYTAWPQDVLGDIDLNEETFAVLLTHDPKIDDPALDVLLNRPVAYIGALGSRKTQQKRQQRLRNRGYDEEVLTRIHGPVGLDIGAETPDEIALSILAEIVKVQRKRSAVVDGGLSVS